MKNSSSGISRRTFLGSTAGLAIASAGAESLTRPAFAAEPLTYITSFGFVVDYAPDLNAHSGGHYAKQGFTSNVIGGRGSSNSIQALVADQAKFTRLGAMEILRARSAGSVDLVAVATLFQSSSFSLVFPTDKKFQKMSDFSGKTVGIMSVGGLSENFLDLMLVSEGVDPTSVKRQVVGNNPGNFELTKLGRIDAFLSSTSTNFTMKQSNLPFTEWSTDNYAPMPGQAFVTLRKVIDNEPALVERFVKAMNASVQEYLTADLAMIYDRLKKDFDLVGDRAAGIGAMGAFRELIVSQGKNNVMKNVPELWTKAATALNKSGLAKVNDVQEAYTNKFVASL